MRRVVITGAGVVSPCGSTIDSTWASITSAKSGIGAIGAFDTEGFSTTIAGECSDFDPLVYIENKRIRQSARFIHLALAASQQAVDASGFDPTDEQKERVGTFVGVGFCGVDYFEKYKAVLMERGPRRVSPYFIPATISNMAPGQVSMRFGYRGPSYAHCSACSSGAHAIGDAARWIQFGKIDAAIAGGAEATITPLSVAGFSAMRALSKRNDAPPEASRPFDMGRDGFVMAEGSGVVMLEERQAATKRGANILAEVVGYGATSDAHHLTQPAPEGEGAQRAMKLALEDAGLSATDVDYVNAHGTSTPVGDSHELQAIRKVFADHAIGGGLAVSSTKSMMGHLLGAAGGVEAVISALAIKHGLIPPTINLEDPDPVADGMNLVPNKTQERTVNVAVSNSFGFGGTNATLVLKRHS